MKNAINAIEKKYAKPSKSEHNMNIPFAAAALLLAVAFFAHLFVGTRETLSQKPDEENTTQQGMRNWMQAVCAFQLVSIDLLLLAAIACLLAFTRVFDGMEAASARFVAVYLGLWCTVWLIQLKMAGARGKNYFLLGQWILFLLCALLMLWGAY